MFQQKSMDLLLKALQFCIAARQKDDLKNGHYIEYYQCKIHEYLALVYTDLFLYKSTKF